MHLMVATDRYGTSAQLVPGVAYHRLAALGERGLGDASRLPVTVKIMLENSVRNAAASWVRDGDVEAIAAWNGTVSSTDRERAFMPARVLLQDFTGVPAVVDLAAMRAAVARAGGDPMRVDPLVPVDLVIDHSVQVDAFGNREAYERNITREYERNRERYSLLRWAQQAFRDFRVVPPGMGIVHQINLEYLAQVVQVRETDGVRTALPDTLVGTDSHTPMVNGIGVLGWGVGGIEAEACMLGQPLFLLAPVVVGVRFQNALPAGTTATDLVLTLTELLRRHGVVNKFVEFCGSGLSSMSVPDRATLSNMSPEFGATASLFPVDDRTLEYLRGSGRDPEHIDLVERYTKEQGMFRTDESEIPRFSEMVELDLATVVPSLAGPKRPQDRVALPNVWKSFTNVWEERAPRGGEVTAEGEVPRLVEEGGIDPDGNGVTAAPNGPRDADLVRDGSVVIAAITSCTNTSNPAVMIAAGLLARNAVARGLMPPDWVKTSLAPGSRVVTDYLERANLLGSLEQLRFNLVGYGCTTCIGNSGPLPETVAERIDCRGSDGRRGAQRQPQLRGTDPSAGQGGVSGIAAARGRVRACGPPRHRPHERPARHRPAGQCRVPARPLAERGRGEHHRPQRDRQRPLHTRVRAHLRRRRALAAAALTDRRALRLGRGFDVRARATVLRGHVSRTAARRRTSSMRACWRCSVTRSPPTTSRPRAASRERAPRRRSSASHGVEPRDFNTYGARRGNHEVMVRGTFANIRLRNQLADNKEGGFTAYLPDGAMMTIFDASARYQAEGVPLIVIAGREYGSGSSRDWAAKGPLLQGVRAVIAQSYERIHRSNLVGMGILPLQFRDGESAETLGLDGTEVYTIRDVAGGTAGVSGPCQRATDRPARHRVRHRVPPRQRHRRGVPAQRGHPAARAAPADA